MNRRYIGVIWALIVVVGLLGLTSCSGPKNKPLAKVEAGDPVFVLNKDRWSATVNDLTQPPPAAHVVAAPTVSYP